MGPVGTKAYHVRRYCPEFPQEREVWVAYAKNLGDGMAELEETSQMSSQPPGNGFDARRKWTWALEALLSFGSVACQSWRLAWKANPRVSKPASVLTKSFTSFNDFTYLPNLVITIEEDVGEGICHDVELQAIKGNVDPVVMKRVKAKFVKDGLDLAPASVLFMTNGRLAKSTALRILFLRFNRFRLRRTSS
jgi:hypothetical protein